MAELFLTDDEKAAEKYFEWNDDALGKLVRWGAIHLAEMRKTNMDEGQIIRFCSMIVFLARDMFNTNATEISYDKKQLCFGDEVYGNYKLTLERTDIPKKEK